MPSHPESVEEIVKDYLGRRSAIIRALTTEVDEFYAYCDPDMENLCLFGYPNDSWAVKPPAEEIPAKLPEPALGINFPRDGMEQRDWASLVGVHSDCWLLSVAFYYAAGFGAEKRKQLFTRINEFETIFEVVRRTYETDDKSSVSCGSKFKGKEKMKSNPKVMDECSVNR